MKKHFAIIFLLVFALTAIMHSCKKDKADPVVQSIETGYPTNIEAIISKKCAVSGCHTNQSKDGAAGLSLETWDKMFEGARGGASVIPYRSDFSTLFYYVNTDSTIGLTLLPTMPVNANPLAANEVNTIKSWIDQGAPNKDGFVKFSDDPNRKKFYVANQGCDVVAVFDAKSMLAMRYVNVGTSPLIEAPHMIKVSGDNKKWFTVFLGSNYFQIYSTADNSLLGQIDIGTGQWNTFSLSSDDSMAYAIDLAGGKIAFIDIMAMTSQSIPGFSSPHGSALNSTNDTLYVSKQTGSGIYKIPVKDIGNYEDIDLVQSFPASQALQIHEIIFSPDGSKYFVTCQKTNEVRVVQTSNDSVIASITVGIYPQELALSQSQPYLFVSCMEDASSNPNERGSIAVINYQSNSFIKKVYAGYQSHGLGVDEVNKRVYVSNRNVNPAGPAPHHTSVCGGRNGNITAIDMMTLELVPNFKAEVSVDPYGLGITH